MSIDWNTVGTWVGAVGTIAAVVVAVGFFVYERRRGRAAFELRYASDAPDWGGVLQPEPAPPSSAGSRLRLSVKNKGPASARAVEGIIHDVEVWTGEGAPVWDRLPGFLPVTVRWSGDPTNRQLSNLVPHSWRTLEIASFQPTASGDGVMVEFCVPDGAERASYRVDMKTVYRFKITVVAENADPFTIIPSFGFSGRGLEALKATELARKPSR